MIIGVGVADSRIPNSGIALATIDRVTDVRAAGKTKLVSMTSRVMYLASTDVPIVQGRESESVERSGERWTGPVNVNVKK